PKYVWSALHSFILTGVWKIGPESIAESVIRKGFSGPCDESEDHGSVSVSAYTSFVQNFLAKAGFRLPDNQDDPEFNREVISSCLALGLPPERTKALAGVGIDAAKWFYPDHSRKLQLLIAKFTGMTTMIDDLGILFPDALANYRTRLLNGQPQDTPILQALLEIIRELDSYFGTFDVDMILKVTLEFLSANLIEFKRQADLRPTVNSPGYTTYFRLKSGVAEAFACFIFPLDRSAASPTAHSVAHLPMIPDLVTFMNEANDILSFYKESLVGTERDNAIHMHARLHGLSLSGALEVYEKSVLGCMSRLRGFSVAEGVESQVEQFLQGYFAFHMMCPRYRLKELDFWQSQIERQ
ncbi:unnamed protein product, partial [Mycena citricolor]